MKILTKSITNFLSKSLDVRSILGWSQLKSATVGYNPDVRSARLYGQFSLDKTLTLQAGSSEQLSKCTKLTRALNFFPERWWGRDRDHWPRRGRPRGGQTARTRSSCSAQVMGESVSQAGLGRACRHVRPRGIPFRWRANPCSGVSGWRRFKQVKDDCQWRDFIKRKFYSPVVNHQICAALNSKWLLPANQAEISIKKDPMAHLRQI